MFELYVILLIDLVGNELGFVGFNVCFDRYGSDLFCYCMFVVVCVVKLMGGVVICDVIGMIVDM